MHIAFQQKHVVSLQPQKNINHKSRLQFLLLYFMYENTGADTQYVKNLKECSVYMRKECNIFLLPPQKKRFLKLHTFYTDIQQLASHVLYQCKSHPLSFKTINVFSHQKPRM